MAKIVLLGGSAGALKALQAILSMLPQNFSAPILIVTHIGSQKSNIPDILGRCSAMPVRHATDGEPIMPGRVLVAPPDARSTAGWRYRSYSSLRKYTLNFRPLLTGFRAVLVSFAQLNFLARQYLARNSSNFARSVERGYP